MFWRLLASLAFLLVASCATNSPADPSACLEPNVGATGQSLGLETAALLIRAHDNYFDPSCTDVPASTELTLVVTNDGRYPHDLTLRDGEGVRVDGGQTAFLVVSTGAGQVRFTCTIHPGMNGELRVIEG